MVPIASSPGQFPQCKYKGVLEARGLDTIPLQLYILSAFVLQSSTHDSISLKYPSISSGILQLIND